MLLTTRSCATTGSRPDSSSTKRHAFLLMRKQNGHFFFLFTISTGKGRGTSNQEVVHTVGDGYGAGEYVRVPLEKFKRLLQRSIKQRHHRQCHVATKRMENKFAIVIIVSYFFLLLVLSAVRRQSIEQVQAVHSHQFDCTRRGLSIQTLLFRHIDFFPPSLASAHPTCSHTHPHLSR